MSNIFMLYMIFKTHISWVFSQSANYPRLSAVSILFSSKVNKAHKQTVEKTNSVSGIEGSKRWSLRLSEGPNPCRTLRWLDSHCEWNRELTVEDFEWRSGVNRLTGLLLPRREAERTADRLIHQARDESSLVWDGIRRGGWEGLDSEHILKLELMRFVDGLS